MTFVSRLLRPHSSDPKWLGAVACFAMGMGVSAIDLAITPPSVASRAAFAIDALASAVFLALLFAFRERLPGAFFQLVTIVSTGLITATIGLNPRHTGNEAYYLLVVLYVSYFFTARQAAAQTALVIAAYGSVTFATVHNGSAGARWLNLSGVLVVVSGVVLLLRARLDTLISSLNEAALTDPLTGLLNRRAFEARIEEEAARSAREGSPLSMLALDLDHFKRVNDRFGHPTGDAVLASVAAVVAATAREGDIVARVGGEELSLLLVGADGELAAEIAERIRIAIADTPHEAAGRLTVSVGVAELDLEDETPALALQRDADRVLYVAKEAGRNRVVRCRPRSLALAALG
jgi:diguanylate cyclase (GGDEF)-like protein